MQTLKIEEDIKKIVENFSKENFIFDLLLAYGISKATVTLTKKGNSNLAKNDNQIIIKKKLFFEANETENLHALIDYLRNDEKTYTHNPRFIIVTDYKTLLAVDTKTKQTLDIEIKDLYKRYDFFLPWSGKEKYVAPEESIADRKAAEKMAKIYDEIVHVNPELTTNHNHALNVFLTRLLFCFFAEDTLIFEDNQFTKAIAENTNDNSSDLSAFIEQLFDALDIEDKSNLPTVFQAFPYVNGHLFSKKTLIPKLTANVRKLIIECGEQDWKEINPDIFGSMFQAVANADIRSGLGQHYTSVSNIMKVINPLFLDNLRGEFEKADTENKLRKLLDRIYGLKIFDPACGSGNFLIIAYKQLRLLEMDIIEKIQEITGQHQLILSQIQLTQFYGIEIDDFACEIATLSLWLAEHQMNRKFKDKFGECRPTLPLKASGKIVCGNATRIDWKKVCPKFSTKELDLHEACEKVRWESMPLGLTYPDKKEEYEIYILGNPPYLGARLQSDTQKMDMFHVFNNIVEGYNNLDYIACWFKKATDYIVNTNAFFSFVTTNSICQGSQVSILWKNLLEHNVEISFAYKSFKWTNNAKGNAGVTCVIIGLRNTSNKPKYVFNEGVKTEVKNINGYLIDYNNIYVEKSRNPISKFPDICFGSMPNDDGNLILSEQEAGKLKVQYPQYENLVKKLLGSQEFIRGQNRYCLWITDEDYDTLENCSEIIERINKVATYRMESKREATNKLADVPYRFGEVRYKATNSIIVPSVSSERREYIPMGYLDKNTVITNAAFAIYNAELWLFGVVTSRMHMVWVRAVAGKLETRLRYSAELCYNTFPFPDITDKQKQIIEIHVNNILEERENYSDMTMAELYDPDKMPEGLHRAHHDLDLVIESCYRRKPFESDEKRLEYLFKMYEIMTDPSKSQDAIEQLSLL